MEHRYFSSAPGFQGKHSARKFEMPTPQLALKHLKLGNKRFVASSSIHHQMHNSRRRHFLYHQRPFAMVLCCSDSRVPAEIIFDCSLGDLFVVRTAGHALDASVLGTIEFGVEVLNVPLLVVLGHENCGAVAAAILTYNQDRNTRIEKHGRTAIESILEGIYPAIQQCGSTEPQAVMEANVLNTARMVMELPSVRSGLETGKLRIAQAAYSLKSGVVRFLAE